MSTDRCHQAQWEESRVFTTPRVGCCSTRPCLPYKPASDLSRSPWPTCRCQRSSTVSPSPPVVPRILTMALVTSTTMCPSLLRRRRISHSVPCCISRRSSTCPRCRGSRGMFVCPICCIFQACQCCARSLVSCVKRYTQSSFKFFY